MDILSFEKDVHVDDLPVLCYYFSVQLVALTYGMREDKSFSNLVLHWATNIRNVAVKSQVAQ